MLLYGLLFLSLFFQSVVFGNELINSICGPIQTIDPVLSGKFDTYIKNEASAEKTLDKEIIKKAKESNISIVDLAQIHMWWKVENNLEKLLQSIENPQVTEAIKRFIKEGSVAVDSANNQESPHISFHHMNIKDENEYTKKYSDLGLPEIKKKLITSLEQNNIGLDVKIVFDFSFSGQPAASVLRFKGEFGNLILLIKLDLDWMKCSDCGKNAHLFHEIYHQVNQKISVIETVLGEYRKVVFAKDNGKNKDFKIDDWRKLCRAAEYSADVGSLTRYKNDTKGFLELWGKLKMNESDLEHPPLKKRVALLQKIERLLELEQEFKNTAN